MYGSIEHLVIQENPIQQAAPSILRNFMIASMPKLKTFNQTMITATERQAAEKAYQPFLGLRNKGIKSFTASASKLSKQQAEEQHIPSRNESYQQIGSVKFVNGTASKSASTAQLPKAEVRINYEDFSQEFDLLIKELVAQSITGCNLRSSTHANGNSSPAK